MFCRVVCCAQSSGCRSLSVMLQKTTDDKSSVMLRHENKRDSQHQAAQTRCTSKSREYRISVMLSQEMRSLLSSCRALLLSEPTNESIHFRHARQPFENSLFTKSTGTRRFVTLFNERFDVAKLIKYSNAIFWTNPMTITDQNIMMWTQPCRLIAWKFSVQTIQKSPTSFTAAYCVPDSFC